jgi:hypothetical protein
MGPHAARQFDMPGLEHVFTIYYVIYQFLKQQTECDGSNKSVLVRIGGVSHEKLVNLILTGCKARLERWQRSLNLHEVTYQMIHNKNGRECGVNFMTLSYVSFSKLEA